MTGAAGVRAAELTALHAALDAAGSGDGTSVLVAGEAGIGKTWLVAKVVGLARVRGATVLHGRCVAPPADGAPGLLMQETVSPDATGRARDAIDSRRLLERVHELLLGGVAAQRLLLLVLEDIHRADTATLESVSLLCHTAPGRRALVVGTYRSDEIRPGHPLVGLADELVRSHVGRTIELGRIGRQELRAVLEDAAGRALPDDLTEMIFRRSAGNPFFARALLDAADRGERTLSALHRNALLQRVARIDPPPWAVLRVAAAIGVDVPYRLLRLVFATMPEPRLTAALRQAVEHGVLVPDRAAGAFRFRHPLVAEAVYGTILPGEAERIHAALARTLTDDPGLGRHGLAAADLARHWAAAGRPAESLASSVRAADDAETVGRFADARRHLDRALRLWPAVPGAECIAGVDEANVLSRAAESAHLTGDPLRAAALVRRAIDLADARPGDPRTGPLYGRLGTYLLPCGDRAAALEACRRAVTLVPAQPPSVERVEVLLSLADTLLRSGQPTASAAACEESMAVADACGAPQFTARALGTLAITLCHLGRHDEARQRIATATDRLPQPAAPEDLARGHAVHSEVLVLSGRPADAARIALEALADVERSGVPTPLRAVLAVCAAEACLENGDWDRVHDLLTRVDRVGAPVWPRDHRLTLARLALRRGQYSAARRCLSVHDHGHDIRRVAAGAELALWEGSPAAATDAIDAELAAWDDEQSYPVDAVLRADLGTLGLRAWADRAHIATLQRDDLVLHAARRRARRLREMVVRATAHAVNAPEAGAWRALADAEYARIPPHVQPDRERGVTAWREAVSGWDALDRPFLVAYCNWRLAEALHTAGTGAEEALRRAREAYRVASALGADPLRREVEALAQRGRLDLIGLPADGRDDTIGVPGLTSREGQVIRLLTRGYTNREIANELTISVKTASVHVSHILRKLGVSNRREAALAAARVVLTRTATETDSVAASSLPEDRRVG
jgi:DNA-binding CsgD family transcriptional regulator